MTNNQTTKPAEKDDVRQERIREAQEQTKADEIAMDETFGFYSGFDPETFERELVYAVRMAAYGY